jgi:hypothetical protein
MKGRKERVNYYMRLDTLIRIYREACKVVPKVGNGGFWCTMREVDDATRGYMAKGHARIRDSDPHSWVPIYQIDRITVYSAARPETCGKLHELLQYALQESEPFTKKAT